MPDGFDLSGALRRIRRSADLSQRELAAAAGVGASTIAHAETGSRDLPVGVLVRAAALAGLRLALLDVTGSEAVAMADGAVRDMADRRFPAHLDTRHGDDRWWYAVHRYDRPQPWYTFDRDRGARDALRRQRGTPDDHQLPQPGDSPQERAAARRRAVLDRWDEERRRRRAQQPWTPFDDGFTCTCPPLCEELDDRSGKPVHAPDCECHCDVA